jgi:ABC-type phosphonate transport system ATPase subunit
MIGISRLAKVFADRTLSADVSLSLHAGSRQGLVGANGSGKTTLEPSGAKRRKLPPAWAFCYPKQARLRSSAEPTTEKA